MVVNLLQSTAAALWFWLTSVQQIPHLVQSRWDLSLNKSQVEYAANQAFKDVRVYQTLAAQEMNNRQPDSCTPVGTPVFLRLGGPESRAKSAGTTATAPTLSGSSRLLRMHKSSTGSSLLVIATCAITMPSPRPHQPALRPAGSINGLIARRPPPAPPEVSRSVDQQDAVFDELVDTELAEDDELPNEHKYSCCLPLHTNASDNLSVPAATSPQTTSRPSGVLADIFHCMSRMTPLAGHKLRKVFAGKFRDAIFIVGPTDKTNYEGYPEHKERGMTFEQAIRTQPDHVWKHCRRIVPEPTLLHSPMKTVLESVFFLNVSELLGSVVCLFQQV